MFGNDEVCVACDKKVLISGEFSHQRAWGVTTIEGATWRGGEAFREEIYGTNFTLSVSGLPAGKYGVVIGVAEVDFTNAGQRVFDITCGDRVLASNSIFLPPPAAREKFSCSPTGLTTRMTRCTGRSPSRSRAASARPS